MSDFKHGAKPVVGLIGAIGAGKSTVAKCFAARGAHVINADALGHEALLQPEIVAALVSRWGAKVQQKDGTLNRRAIGQIVFNNAQERSALEAVVFPEIGRRTLEEIHRAQANPAVAFIVLDAAVMLEAGWQEMVDSLVYVDAPRELRLERVALRSGWDDAELTAREAAQWPTERKKRLANCVLVNDSETEVLLERVDSVIHELKLPTA